MSAGLTWHQQQRRALGLPFEGAQPPALVIALYDAAQIDLGLEKYSLFAPLTDDFPGDADDMADSYLSRIARIIRQNNLFDGLVRPMLNIKCIPGLDADGTFPPGESISNRDLDWLAAQENYAKPARKAETLLANVTGLSSRMES